MLIMITGIRSFSQNDWIVLPAGIDENLHDIEFMNDSTGVIYSYGTGHVYRTENAGLNWTLVHQTDSLYLEQIQFINPTTGWICGEKGTILKTSDGGRTWSDLPVRSDSGNLLLYGMFFHNELTGYVSGGIMDRNSNITPKIFHTTDGGNCWVTVLSDIPVMVLNIEKPNEQILATGHGFIIEFQPDNRAWRYLFKDTTKTVGQIRDIAFSDDQTGIGASFSGKTITTRDGGNHWIIEPVTTNRLRSIVHCDGNHWIMSGDDSNDDGSVLYESTDNGYSWTSGNDFPDIHRVTCSSKHIWIAGKKGFIGKKIK